MATGDTVEPPWTLINNLLLSLDNPWLSTDEPGKSMNDPDGGEGERGVGVSPFRHGFTSLLTFSDFQWEGPRQLE